jgi:HlyD family secretion protein
MARPEDHLRQLAAALGLTESQQNHVRGVLSEARGKIQALQRQNAAPDEIRRETAAQGERIRNSIAVLLSPEQRETFARLPTTPEGVSVNRGRVYIAGENGKPRPVDVTLGIGDGTFTEVLEGDIQAGQPVLIGVNPTAAKPSARAARRFGF